MSKVTIIFSAIIMVIFATSCSKNKEMPSGVTGGPNYSAASSVSSSGNTTNGVGSAIPAYYDSTIFRIIFVEFSANAEANLIAHNNSLNFIYRSDNGLPNNKPFISVIDAIPGDGMNPVWREVQIVFNSGFTPRQLYSDNEVLAAASGSNPEITLNMTNEVYYCPVINHK